MQLRLEAQGKYLQDVLEKAHDSLGRDNSGTSGLEAAKVELSDLVCQVSTQCLNSAFSGMKQLSDLCLKQAKTAQPTDCSVDSCLTSCEGTNTMREQELYQNPMGLKYINFREPRNMIGNNFATANDNVENAYVTQTNLDSLSMNIGLQGGQWSSDSTRRKKSSPQLELHLLSTGFDLNTDEQNNVASRCNQLDLNGFSWS